LLRAAHVSPLAHDHIVNLPASLDLVNELVPLLECMQKASAFNSGMPPSPLPSSLIAHPAKEALEELSRDLVITLRRILSDEDAVSKEERSQEVGPVPRCIRYNPTDPNVLLLSQAAPVSSGYTAAAGDAIHRDWPIQRGSIPEDAPVHRTAKPRSLCHHHCSPLVVNRD
jgi:hypothetical protein